MKVERIRPAVFRVTLHAFELSALIAAGRWVAEGAEGEISDEALNHLRQVLAAYDAEAHAAGAQSVSPGGPDSSA